MTSRSQRKQEECSLAITGQLSLRSSTVASDRARSRSLVGRQYVRIVVDSIYRGKAGETKTILDRLGDDELPTEASN